MIQLITILLSDGEKKFEVRHRLDGRTGKAHKGSILYEGKKEDLAIMIAEAMVQVITLTMRLKGVDESIVRDHSKIDEWTEKDVPRWNWGSDTSRWN